MTHGFGLIPIQPNSLLGEGEVEAFTSDYMSALKGLGGERWTADSIPADPAQLFLLVATGCFGLAQLTDEGVIAGCEGDLVSTVGLLWARELLGVTPWMANPAQLDSGSNTFWLAHCTVPRTLVESYRLRSHFESGLGVGIQGALPTGPVTLLRIGGKKMDRLLG